MDIIDCTASSEGWRIDLKEINKGLTDGEAHAIPMCTQEKGEEKDREREVTLIKEIKT